MKQQKDVNLILGPGGAKGFVHVGAIKELLAQEYKINSIVGISIGAIIAWGYGFSNDITKVEQMALDFNSSHLINSIGNYLKLNTEDLKDYLIGLSNGKDYSFEELSLPVTVVVTNAQTGKPQFINTGSVVDAIIASSLTPFIHKPYVIDGMEYYDGGLSINIPNMLPSKVKNEHPYIAIEVAPNNDSMVTKLIKRYYYKNSKENPSILVPIPQIINIPAHPKHIKSTEFNKIKDGITFGMSIIKERIEEINSFVLNLNK